MRETKTTESTFPQDAPERDRTIEENSRSWAEFFKQAEEVDFPEDFLADRELQMPLERDSFDEPFDSESPLEFATMTKQVDRWHIRLAQEADIPELHALIEASIRGLQANDYTPAQIEGALGTVLGLDTQLIRDQTYYVVEVLDESGSSDAKRSRVRNAGCGGWSKRKTLFGSDGAATREPELLDPATDAAKIRAIFVHPDFARQGLGSLILAQVEGAAQAAGFRSFEMGSTLTGVPLYMLRGYTPVERVEVPLWNGEVLPVIKMTKPA